MHLYRLIPILMSLMLLTLSTAHANPPTGAVTSANSITGSASGDQVGLGGVYVLPSGNIVIVSPQWNVSRGAVTCLTPSEYQAGNIVVSAGNSLTGENIGSRVGNGGITILANGNYVVSSPNWGTDPSGLESQGAATWVDGKTCLPFGEATRNALVNSANSLVGVSSTDQVSSGGVVALNNNANYVVISPKHAGNSGAVTWVNGQTGLSGGISDTNSLVGASNLDQIGSKGVVTLTNGNYVVVSPLWDRSGITDTGAVTWVNGKTGAPVGLVSQTNSLVGTTANDRIGDTGVLALSNGNYVVQSISWDNGSTPNVGAVTWGDGKLGTKGAVGTTNSIVGLGSNDALGGRVIPLTNGNYLVIDDDWNSVGAVR